jgi:hypothetical protein
MAAGEGERRVPGGGASSAADVFDVVDQVVVTWHQEASCKFTNNKCSRSSFKKTPSFWQYEDWVM